MTTEELAKVIYDALNKADPDAYFSVDGGCVADEIVIDGSFNLTDVAADILSALHTETGERPALTPDEINCNLDPVPKSRCPLCWTYGHTHRKDCRYKDDGMQHHVPI